MAAPRHGNASQAALLCCQHGAGQRRLPAQPVWERADGVAAASRHAGLQTSHSHWIWRWEKEWSTFLADKASPNRVICIEVINLKINTGMLYVVILWKQSYRKKSSLCTLKKRRWILDAVFTWQATMHKLLGWQKLKQKDIVVEMQVFLFMNLMKSTQTC